MRLCLVECKIFSGENIFGKGKYFQVFGCVVKMLQKTHFYHVSHIFLGSKQILLQKSKQKKSKSQDQSGRDRFVGSSVRMRDGLIGSWVRGTISPVDEVGRSIRGVISLSRGGDVDSDQFVGSWHDLTVAWRGRGQRSDQRDLELDDTISNSLCLRVCESFLSLSLSLFACLRK